MFFCVSIIIVSIVLAWFVHYLIRISHLIIKLKFLHKASLNNSAEPPIISSFSNEQNKWIESIIYRNLILINIEFVIQKQDSKQKYTFNEQKISQYLKSRKYDVFESRLYILLYCSQKHLFNTEGELLQDSQIELILENRKKIFDVVNSQYVTY
ncbi:hypothetical protein E1I18_01575 [Mycoplasmopsis mucosicanis]|uniref:Uncharacterized protein n=1 Tax=Mycoplasmopsis mucosicanis TaxID=458208 RepID=A0A507SQG8_9BACT|nr:hypothetical protein [Mycoplasmopsis mucosicanis]TQC51578.1 hypothetical protein E1I18_01575 [Mycoplasmopsis mucosicanis]